MVGMYRVLVTGSGKLKKDSLARFSRALGRRIMAERDFVLVTGGLKELEEGNRTVDHEVVRGALDELDKLHGDPQERILTVVPAKEFKEAKRFNEGKVESVKYSNLRSRRYAMVHMSDVVIAIEGRKATKENIDLAWTLGKPLLPVPCTGGNAKEAWDQYGDELRRTLHLKKDEIRTLSAPPTASERLADCCVSILRRMIRPRCFIAMKFEKHPVPWAHRAIEEVARDKCYEPVRIDKLPGISSIVDAMWSAIRSSDVFIADISGNSPNVFYELGIAHALRKDVTILLHRRPGRPLGKIPFDISGYRVITYDDPGSLRAGLTRELMDQSHKPTSHPQPAHASSGHRTGVVRKMRKKK